MTIEHDYSEVERLDAAFAAKRYAEAYATRAAARGTLIKRVGVASLLGGLGVGAALFGASFLIVPKERVVTLLGRGRARYRQVRYWTAGALRRQDAG